MKLIKADHDRRLVIPGVPGEAKRPVDIDVSVTGFKVLRTLRIYQFDAQAVVDGHAEEDEVYVVVLSGSIDLKISEDGSEGAMLSYHLDADTEADSDGFVAYLPPRSAYRLTPLTATDVAYARAMPLGRRAPAVFRATRTAGAGVCLLLDEQAHASQFRLHAVQVHAQQKECLVPLRIADAVGEGLAHVRGTPPDDAARLLRAGAEPVPLRSWDTVALDPGDGPVLEVAKGALVSVFTVFAK